MWDLSCPDWETRIREGRSLIPDLPLFEDEARMGLSFYDELRLPDVPGTPKLRQASGQWFRDIVRASFGSWDPVNRIRMIRDIFAMAPKGSSKTSYSAGLMISVMLMTLRLPSDIRVCCTTKFTAEAICSRIAFAGRSIPAIMTRVSMRAIASRGEFE